MGSKLFLFNTTLLPLGISADPRLDPAFPLSKEQYDALSTEDLMHLLREEYRNDPDLLHHQPKIALSLCALLHAKGGVNCIKAHWDGYGVSSRHGAVPAASLVALQSLEKEGKLTEKIVEDAVWSQIGLA